jgi:pyridine nucleotide-disulfide oxidoreductase family protein
MKRLLLLGGGHSHLRVMAQLARRPLEGWQVELLTPSPRQIYSGMLPGWVAGHYQLDQCAIELHPLAARAGIRFTLGSAAALDAAQRQVTTEDGRTRGYDLLSIDVGAQADAGPIAGADEHAVGVRPMEDFVQQWDGLVRRIHGQCKRFDVLVLGAGAGGVELALALRHRALREGWSHLHVALAGTEAKPLASAPPAAQARALALMRQRGVAWHGQRRAVEVGPGEVRFDDGSALPADTCWLVTGAAALPWLAASGLACDDRGFVRVDATLRSLSHPDVFAAGDAAAHPTPLPRSGVYAVRAGAVLARNLPAACRGEPLTPWRPQRRALYLVSSGDRHAMAIWGGWVWAGRWVWRWKDGIDRRFVDSYAVG